METIQEAIELLNPFKENTHGRKVFRSKLIDLLSLVAEEFWDKGHWQAQNNRLSNTFGSNWEQFTDNLKEK